jgi:hypothetical protein
MSAGKQSGSLMNASATAGSRLSQSKGVRAGSNAVLRKLYSRGEELAGRTNPSRAPDPDSTRPSIRSL